MAVALEIIQCGQFDIRVTFTSYIRALNFSLRAVGIPFPQDFRFEQLSECHPELSAHRTVKDEVNSAIY